MNIAVLRTYHVFYALLKKCILIVGSVLINVSILLIYYLNVKIFNF